MSRAAPNSAASKIAALVRATRPLAHANIAPPILYGQALAFAATGSFSLEGLAIAHGFGVLDHLFIVLANDYADRHGDAKNRTFTPFSGGSRVLPEGALAPATIRTLALASALALLLGSLALAATHPLLPWLAAAAIALMLAYSYPPLRLSYRGGGEWLQALGVGVVLPLVGFHAQGGTLAGAPWLALLPTAAMGLAGNVLTALPDEPADRDAGKRTWAVRRGIARAQRELLALIAIAILLGAACVPLASPLTRALVTALPLAFLATALPLQRAARPGAPGMTHLMLVLGAASTGAIVAWTIALFAGA